MFKLMDKKIITILTSKFLLNWPYEDGLNSKATTNTTNVKTTVVRYQGSE